MRGFIIHKDHLDGRRSGQVVLWRHFHEAIDRNAVAKEFARDVEVGRINSARFKAYDDDGNLYYEGRTTISRSGVPGDEDEWRAYKWMQADAGVTYMKIMYREQDWEHYP